MHTDVIKMKEAHQTLMSYPFTLQSVDRGYANRSLRIDVGKLAVRIDPVLQQMKDLWVGGKGFDLWLMLKEINSDTKWDSPDNPICFSSGPLGGTASFPGSGKTIVTAISPTTNSIMDCNVGGYFGPYLKWAGFDALTITGKSPEEIVVVIDTVAKKISIERAPLESIDAHLITEELTAMYAKNEDDKRNIAVVCAGQAAQHTRLGVLNFSFYDWRRQVARLKQAGRGGIGTVFRNKKIKAIVIRCHETTPIWQISPSKAAKYFSAPQTGHTCHAPMAIDTARINTIMQKWQFDTEYVIEMLQDIQDEFRYIPKDAVDIMSRTLKLSKGQLYHLITFYKAFSLHQLGETVIQVCMGTACHVKGAPRILDAFERELAIKAHATTKDGKFTIDPVACLGCCSIAPVVKIGEKIIGDITTKDVARLIKDRGNKHE